MRRIVVVMGLLLGLLFGAAGVAHADPYITNHGARTVTVVNNQYHVVIVQPKVQVKRYETGQGYAIRSVVAVHCYGKFSDGRTFDTECERHWTQRLHVGNPNSVYHQFAVGYVDVGGSAKVGSWKTLNPCRDYYQTDMGWPLIDFGAREYGAGAIGNHVYSNKYQPQNPSYC